MADSIFAAASTTPPSSSERISSEFMSQGSSNTGGEGSVLGGFDVRTPKVGDGFIEWAVNGYDLNGCTKTNTGEYCYDKHGDWMFDKSVVIVPATQERVYDQNYAKKEK